MTIGLEVLAENIHKHCADKILSTTLANDELTIEVSAQHLIAVCYTLRDNEAFGFEMLIDLCGVDYSHYGHSEWTTEEATSVGFSRGVGLVAEVKTSWQKPTMAVVYHLLSLKNNQRIRLRSYPEGEPLLLPSVIEVWNVANWFEREAFDLFGILFDGHPDLRRILTDYGFVGHPFRKDFPLIGQVEMRYDAAQKRCVYEPVSIESRTLVPRVIRHDNRYNDAVKGT